MAQDRARRRDRKLELAARAAWLYYIAGKTQDAIAAQLNVSRQAVQRLVSLAVSQKLIKFRLDHPLADCMALAEALRGRFDLVHCTVEPADATAPGPIAGIAIGAAEYLATFLAQRQPLVLAFSTGRTLRAMADELPSMECPQHRLVSLVGAVSREGQASSYDVVRRLAERTGAACFPMPTPVVAGSVEERRLLQTQRSFAVVRELAAEAAVAFVGIGQIAWAAPLHRDHFVTDAEISELIDRGAVGEIAGWAYDSAGRLVAGGSNERNAGLPFEELRRGRVVGVGGGREKVVAIASALRGGLLAGLVTDEATAAGVLRLGEGLTGGPDNEIAAHTMGISPLGRAQEARHPMVKSVTAVAFAAALLGSSALARAETLTIATVNNADMIVMQRLAPKWEQASGHTLNWVVLEENVLRQRATTDIATQGGQFDIITIGSYEAPIWGKSGWLNALDDLGDDYDYADLIPSVKSGLSHEGKLYAAPFYAESSFTFYRKDLFEAAGLTMPEAPTYDQVKEFAAKLTDKSKDQYGVCLRGKPGWGENMAFVGPMVNAFGGRWFDEEWTPQLTSQPWTDAVSFYVEMMKESGPPGATANGHNENRALFATGRCAMWIDATSAAGYIFNPKESQVADKTAFAAAPIEVTANGSGWFWSWALGVPTSSKKTEAAKSFLKWATSKDYVKLVGESEGWVAAPPGTRKSTYDNPEYQKAAPFATTVYNAISNADTTKPTKDPVPYTGIQYVAIPEFQGIGTQVGQQVAAALAGQVTAEQALQTAQRSTERTMRQAGYPK